MVWPKMAVTAAGGEKIVGFASFIAGLASLETEVTGIVLSTYLEHLGRTSKI